MSIVFFLFLCSFGNALKDDRSHMGGSDDMQSLVFIGGICVGYCGTHIVSGCVYCTLHLGIHFLLFLVVIIPSIGG